jgi:hypothetical protein
MIMGGVVSAPPRMPPLAAGPVVAGSLLLQLTAAKHIAHDSPTSIHTRMLDTPRVREHPSRRAR